MKKLNKTQKKKLAGTNKMAGKDGISYPDEGNDLFFEVEDRSFWYRHRNDCILALLRQFPPAGLLYDVGGGNGCVAKALEDHGFQTVLVEPGKAGIANARKRGLKNIICARLEDLDSQFHSMSAVGLFDVMEHMADPDGFLKSISGLLVPGGMLYITVPAFKALWSHDDVFAGHKKRYSLKNMGEMLHRNGFEVLYATYIFSVLPVPIFIFRAMPHRLRFVERRGASYKKRFLRDHTQVHRLGILGRLVESASQLELHFIRSQKKIPAGSSCLIAARIERG